MSSEDLGNMAPPTGRQDAPAPQSLRRLFHDESSIDSDPFQSFAHQQPVTPASIGGSGSIEQSGRFDSPSGEESEIFGSEDSTSNFDSSTIRQRRLGANSPSGLSIVTRVDTPSGPSSTMSDSTYQPESSQAPTPIARQDGNLPLPPSLARQLRPKMSLDTLSSNPTSRSQPEQDRKDSAPMRRPGGSVSEGLRGFQFPLVTKPHGPAFSAGGIPRAPPLQRNFSAAPAFPSPVELSGRPEHSGSSSLGLGGPPARPPMMRQASVAVMEGRSQAQAQALAMVQADDDPLSPSGGLIPPRAPFAGGQAIVMTRTRSGSRTDGEVVALRDLMKVCPVRSK
jgi:protein-serine/threonine kinase